MDVVTEIAPPDGGDRVLAAVTRLLPTMAARAEAHDIDATFPADDIDDLRAAGALAVQPEQPSDLMALLRLVGRGSLSVGRVFEGHVNALALVARYGTRAQQDAAASDARAGHLFGVWNTQSRTEKLVLSDGRLTGGKTLASAAGFVTRPLVTADLAGGARQMLLLHLEPGTRTDLSGWTPQGMRATATGSIALDGIAVTSETLIGGPDDYIRQPEFSAGAWRVLAVMLGGLDALIDGLRAHLRQTGRDGDPHQLARAGRALILHETVRLWVDQAARRAHEADDADAIVAYVDLARGAVEAACIEAMAIVQRSVGLTAFMRPNPLERVARDLATYLRQPNPDGALVSGAAHFLHHP